MGYSTEFNGSFSIAPALSAEDRIFLTKFSQTRRVKRNLGPEFGVEGEFYVDGKGFMGQDTDDSVIDDNKPPKTQPGLWCQWIPNEDGTELEWDGGEKFYEFIPWLEYLISAILAPRGYVLNGSVKWEGEDSGDLGKIFVDHNDVVVKNGRVIYE